jgi:formylglycine-generating enzyme required for sulfatase activity
MHGNVYQWCADAEGSVRVFRGGRWDHGGSSCQAANRNWSAPANRFDYLGFRLARVPVR